MRVSTALGEQCVMRATSWLLGEELARMLAEAVLNPHGKFFRCSYNPISSGKNQIFQIPCRILLAWEGKPVVSALERRAHDTHCTADSPEISPCRPYKGGAIF
jgi:hypothetical protein